MPWSQSVPSRTMGPAGQAELERLKQAAKIGGSRSFCESFATIRIHKPLAFRGRIPWVSGPTALSDLFAHRPHLLTVRSG